MFKKISWITIWINNALAPFKLAQNMKYENCLNSGNLKKKHWEVQNDDIKRAKELKIDWIASIIHNHV